MPFIKVADIAYGRLRAPDLDRMEEFLTRFGTVRVDRTPTALDMPKVRDTGAWYRELLGFIFSDDVYAGDPNNLIGSFNRCARGEHYVDHHVFFCLAHDKTGLNHHSFEVQDIDDVCMGHHSLK